MRLVVAIYGINEPFIVFRSDFTGSLSLKLDAMWRLSGHEREAMKEMTPFLCRLTLFLYAMWRFLLVETLKLACLWLSRFETSPSLA